MVTPRALVFRPLVKGNKDSEIEDLASSSLWYYKYSCFEKGCPTKPHATMPKGIMGNWGSWSLIEDLGVSAT